MRLFILVISLVFTQTLTAQQMAQYDQDFVFKEGLYLSLSDFKNNTPAPKTAIETKLNINSPDFYNELLASQTVQIRLINDSILEVPTGQIWGYSRNGNIYVNYSDDFYRIPVLGRLSHFVANVEVLTTGFYDPWYGATTEQARNELRQFIMEFETGKVYEYTLENFEKLLMADEALYKEFSNLKPKLKRQNMFLYLRKYNDAHPIFFPIG